MFDLYFRESFRSTAALFYAVCIAIGGSIPLWGFLCFVTYKIIPFKQLSELTKQKFLSSQKLLSCCNKKKSNEQDDAAQQENVDEHGGNYPELPDRVMNPELYDEATTY